MEFETILTLWKRFPAFSPPFSPDADRQADLKPLISGPLTDYPITVTKINNIFLQAISATKSNPRGLFHRQV
jgi:hypothetical protein